VETKVYTFEAGAVPAPFSLAQQWVRVGKHCWVRESKQCEAGWCNRGN
jgi:hypothetical protein